MDKAGIKEIFEKYKYPIIMLLAAVVLLLFPSDSRDSAGAVNENAGLQDILCASEGVGRAIMVISDKGVVISCDGADDARVRLEIIRAVSSYTGISTDKIIILKMEK